MAESLSSARPAPDRAVEDGTGPSASHAPRLPYGTAAAAGTSVLAWTGLGFAVLGALLAATQVLIVLREAGSGGRFSLAVGLHFFLLPVLAVVLAAAGARRRPKRWPAVAVAIAALSMLTLLLLSSRTWGAPPAGGQSPWHRPLLEWPG